MYIYNIDIDSWHEPNVKILIIINIQGRTLKSRSELETPSMKLWCKGVTKGALCVKLRRMARLACGGGRIEDWHADAYRPMSSRVFPSTECQMIRSHGTAQRPWMAISLKKEIGIWRCHQILLLLTFIKDIIWYDIVANQSIYNYTYHAMKQNYMPCNESE